MSSVSCVVWINARAFGKRRLYHSRLIAVSATSKTQGKHAVLSSRGFVFGLVCMPPAYVRYVLDHLHVCGLYHGIVVWLWEQKSSRLRPESLPWWRPLDLHQSGAALIAIGAGPLDPSLAS